MRSAINFTVLPSVSIALADADAIAAVAIATLHHDVAVLAGVARTLARATTIRFDRSVLAAVNLATIASVPRALADTFSRLARPVSATVDIVTRSSAAFLVRELLPIPAIRQAPQTRRAAHCLRKRTSGHGLEARLGLGCAQHHRAAKQILRVAIARRKFSCQAGETIAEACLACIATSSRQRCMIGAFEPRFPYTLV